MASWKFPGKNRQKEEGSLHPPTQVFLAQWMAEKTEVFWQARGLALPGRGFGGFINILGLL